MIFETSNIESLRAVCKASLFPLIPIVNLKEEGNQCGEEITIVRY